MAIYSREDRLALVGVEAVRGVEHFLHFCEHATIAGMRGEGCGVSGSGGTYRHRTYDNKFYLRGPPTW